MFPMAHDIHGTPISVPPGAVAWRVRRQTAGRPGLVLGLDGGPLTVPLISTPDELRMAGCGPGTYRLDAVDDAGRPLGAVAFTQLEDEQPPAPPPPPTPDGDALITSVNALARSIENQNRNEGMVRVMEAMQRTQAEQGRMLSQLMAERDKTMAQVVVALVERAGSAAGPADLRGQIRQAIGIQDALDDFNQRRQDAIVANIPAEAPAPQPSALQSILAQLPTLVPALMNMALMIKALNQNDAAMPTTMPGGTPAAAVGSTDPLAAGLTPDPSPAASASAPHASGEASPAASVPPPTSGSSGLPTKPDTAKTLLAVLAALSAEEAAQVNASLKKLAPQDVDALLVYLSGLDVDSATAAVRLHLLRRRPPREAATTAPPGSAPTTTGTLTAAEQGIASSTPKAAP